MSTERELYEIEVLDGELVAPAHRPPEALHGEWLPGLAAQPGVQTAMAAATGFVAGAATMALLRRYGQARIERTAAAAPALERVRPGQPRTYVVTVRQLG